MITAEEIRAAALQLPCPFCHAKAKRGCERVKRKGSMYFGERSRTKLHMTRLTHGKRLLQQGEMTNVPDTEPATQ